MNFKPFVIFTGDEKTMNLKAVLGNCGSDYGDPLDLTSCTEIDIALPNADGTFKHLLLSEDEVEITSPAILGKYSALITTEVSELLNPGELQSFNVTFTIAGVIETVKYVQALSVLEQG